MAALELSEDQVDEDASPKTLGQPEIPKMPPFKWITNKPVTKWNNVKPLGVFRILGFCGPEAHWPLGLEWWAWAETSGPHVACYFRSYAGVGIMLSTPWLLTSVPSGQPLIRRKPLPTPPSTRQSIPQNHLRQERRDHDDLNGKTIHERRDICICLADSLCCTVETDATL